MTPGGKIIGFFLPIWWTESDGRSSLQAAFGRVQVNVKLNHVFLSLFLKDVKGCPAFTGPQKICHCSTVKALC